MTSPLHGYTAGSPDQPALLFLHGFLGSHAEWRPLIERLSDAFHCLAVDLPGHGRTPASDDPAAYTLPGAAAAVEEFLDARGVERVHVVGYSMGGRLALYWAVHRPDRCGRVVMESASPGLLESRQAPARRALDERWAARFEAGPLAEVLADWYRQPLFASLHEQPEVWRAMWAQRLRNRPEEVARSLRGMSVAAQASLWGRLASLTVPLLVLAGERDGKYRAIAARMAAAAPRRVETRTVADAGHNAHVEQPSAVADLIRAWIALERSSCA